MKTEPKIKIWTNPIGQLKLQKNQNQKNEKVEVGFSKFPSTKC